VTPRAVKLVAGSLALAGTAAVLAVLLVSSKPDAKSPAKKPLVNVEKLAPGQVIHLDTESMRYFVVRPPTGEIHVVAVPTEQGTVLMPDIHWWKPLMNCKDFGLNAVGGTVTSESRFRCRDAEQPDAWVNQWQWDLFGKHIVSADGSKLDNMYRVRFERSGNEVSFAGLEPD
jgi:hypothetical protein